MVMGFCLGSILFAYEIPRMVKHVDIRQISEDGNPGTFNAFAAAGVGWESWCFLQTAERFFSRIFVQQKSGAGFPAIFAGVLAAPVFGHAFSIFHKGKGGKGIAVMLGVLLGLLPWWTPVLTLAGFYIFFSLAVPVKSHLKRSIITFWRFGVASLFPQWEFSVRMGILLLCMVVVYKHVEAARELEFADKRNGESNESVDFILQHRRRTQLGRPCYCRGYDLAGR